MAISSSTDYVINRSNIIIEALQMCGVLADGEFPHSDQILSCARTLNLIAKAWQADGLQVWKRKTGSIPLVVDQVTYTMGDGGNFADRPLRILSAWRHHDSSEVDTDITILSDQEYHLLSNKNQSGQVVSCFYEPLWPQGKLHVWQPASSTGYTLKFRYHVPFADFDEETDDPDFPQEWMLALTMALAVKIAPKYGVPRQERELLMADAMAEKERVLSWDTEGMSVFLRPSEYQYGHGAK